MGTFIVTAIVVTVIASVAYSFLWLAESAYKAVVRLMRKEKGPAPDKPATDSKKPVVHKRMSKLSAILLAPLEIYLKWLAEQDIFFTTCKEGTIKTIVKGATADHFIMSFAGYHLNDPRMDFHRVTDREGKVLQQWEVIYHGAHKQLLPDEQQKMTEEELAKTKDDYYDNRPEFLKRLGLYWVGLPWRKSVYVYPFSWNETITRKLDGKEEIRPREEPTNFIYVADFTYAIKTDGAETRDRIPVDVLTFVTVAIRNPYRALFSGEDWMQRVTSVVNRQVRNFVGSKGYDELIYPMGTAGNGSSKPDMREITAKWAEEFSQPIIRLTDFLPDENETSKPPYGLSQRYGVTIRTADLQTIEIAGDEKTRDALQEAATRIYTAQKEADATILDGAAKADVIEKTGEKEAKALATRLEVIREHGEAGQQLAQLDAMTAAAKGPGTTIIWANNPLLPISKMLSTVVNKGKEGDKT